MENKSILNQKLFKSRAKLITSSTLWAGLGFFIIALLCIGFSFIIKATINNNFDNTYFIISGIASLVGLIIGLVFEFKWSFNVINSSWAVVITAILCNILSYTLLLAPWLALIQDSWIVTTALATTGLSFIALAICGSFISDKTAFSLFKIAGVLSLIFFIFQMIFIFILIFAFRNYQTWQLIYNSLFILILVPYILLSFWQISKTEQFYSELESNEHRQKVSLFFGLIILKQFITLLMVLIRMFSYFKQ